jgi:hypothetical protein
MKRWIAVTVVLGCLVGVGAYFLMPFLCPALWTHHSADKTSTSSNTDNAAAATGLEADVKHLVDEFQTKKDVQPSDATRKLIGQLVARGEAGKATVPVLEAWLKRMYDAGQPDAPEFREFAQTLLKIDPDQLRMVVAEIAGTTSRKDGDFCAYKLVAFGQAALPAVLEGLRKELQASDRAAVAAWSKLPWVRFPGCWPGSVPRRCRPCGPY